MPSRKAHSKSRNGCETCKKRRVKCDEQGWPTGPCAACVIRKTECVYRTQSNIRTMATPPVETGHLIQFQVSSSPSSRHTATGINDSPVLTPRSGQTSHISLNDTTHIHEQPEPPSRLQELRLMHFWCIKTCHTFDARDNAQHHLWHKEITSLAFEHNYLLDIILALTSIHIASEEPDVTLRSTHVNTALLYQNKAFVTFRTALKNVTSENCNAIIAFALINMACSTVSTQLRTGTNDQARSPLESAMTLYDAVCVLSELILQTEKWLVGGPFENILSPKYSNQAEATGESDYRKTYTADESASIRASMQRLRLMNSQIAVEKHPLYSKAIALLEEQFFGWAELSIAWLALCGSAFFSDVRTEEPMALMILMHWGVLFDQMDSMWWAQYSGKKLVEQLSQSLRLHDDSKEWNDAISWSRDHVGLQQIAE